MCPESVVACCDTETRAVVVDNTPDQGLELERRARSCDAADQWNDTDEDHVQPVDMLVPVLHGDGCVGDVRSVSWLDVRG